MGCTCRRPIALTLQKTTSPHLSCIYNVYACVSMMAMPLPHRTPPRLYSPAAVAIADVTSVTHAAATMRFRLFMSLSKYLQPCLMQHSCT